MAYVTGDIISAIDLISLINGVNAIWGRGTGDVGYGQDPLSTSGIVTGSEISYRQWADLRDRIIRAAGHQGTSISIDSDIPSDGDTIDIIENLQSSLNRITQNHLNIADMILTDEPGVVVTGTARSNVNWHEHGIKISFLTGNQARYFFNCGGQIVIDPGGTGVHPSGDWSTLFANLGTIILSANNTIREGNITTDTQPQTIFTNGYYQLQSSSNAPRYTTSHSGVPTSGNDDETLLIDLNQGNEHNRLLIYAWTNGPQGSQSDNGSDIYLRILYDTDYDSQEPGINYHDSETINQNIVTNVSLKTPATTHLISDSWGIITVTEESNTFDTTGPRPAPSPSPSLPNAVAGDVTITGSTTNMAEDSTRTFSASSTGGTYDTVSYSWSDVGSGGVSPTTGSSTTYTSANYSVSTSYSVSVSVTATYRGTGTNAANGTSATDTASEAFNVVGVASGTPAPSLPNAVAGDLSISGSTINLHENLARVFSASSTGGTYDTVSYVWSETGAGSVSPTTGSSTTYTATNYDTSGFFPVTVQVIATYRGTGTNAANNTSAADTATRQFNVVGVGTASMTPALPNAVAGDVTITGSTTNMAEDSTRTFSASSTGGTYDTVSYSWSDVGSGGVSPTTGSSTTYTSANYSVSTSYSVSVSVTATYRGTGTNAANGTSATDTASAAFNVNGVSQLNEFGHQVQ